MPLPSGLDLRNDPIGGLPVRRAVPFSFQERTFFRSAPASGEGSRATCLPVFARFDKESAKILDILYITFPADLYFNIDMSYCPRRRRIMKAHWQFQNQCAGQKEDAYDG